MNYGKELLLNWLQTEWICTKLPFDMDNWRQDIYMWLFHYDMVHHEVVKLVLKAYRQNNTAKIYQYRDSDISAYDNSQSKGNFQPILVLVWSNSI